MILVSNHVNAFMDPVMLPMFFYKAVYYIVRGDVFKGGFVQWFLEKTNQIPMFRMRDGLENVKRNDATFERCYDLLSRNNIIMIFSEGDCVQEKRLRPLQKGTARMAFGAIEKYGWDIDLHLQTSSVNYTYPSKFRTEVMVALGKAVPLNRYRALYEESPAQAIKQVTLDLQRDLREIYIELEFRDDFEVFEQLVQLVRNGQKRKILPWVSKSFERIDSERNLSDFINKTHREKPQQLSAIKEVSSLYFDALQRCRLSDSAFGVNRPGLWFSILAIILGFPFFVIGYLYNVLAYRWVEGFIRKRIKDVIFVNSVRLLVYFIVMATQCALLTIIIAWLCGWWAIVLIPSAFVISWAAINYYDFAYEVENSWRYNMLRQRQPAIINDLLTKRQRLVDFIGS